MRSKILIMIMSLVMMRRGEAPADACCISGIAGLATIMRQCFNMGGTNFNTPETTAINAQVAFANSFISPQGGSTGAATKMRSGLTLAAILLSVAANNTLVTTASLLGTKLFIENGLAEKFLLARAIGKYMKKNQMTLDDKAPGWKKVREYKDEINTIDIMYHMNGGDNYSYWNDVINLSLDGIDLTQIHDAADNYIKWILNPEADTEHEPWSLPHDTLNLIKGAGPYLSLALCLLRGSTVDEVSRVHNPTEHKEPLVFRLAKNIQTFANYFAIQNVLELSELDLTGNVVEQINKSNYQKIETALDAKQSELIHLGRYWSEFYSYQLDYTTNLLTSTSPNGNTYTAIRTSIQGFLDTNSTDHPTSTDSDIVQKKVETWKSLLKDDYMEKLETYYKNIVKSIELVKKGKPLNQQALTTLNQQLNVNRVQLKLANLIKQIIPGQIKLITEKSTHLTAAIEKVKEHINGILPLLDKDFRFCLEGRMGEDGTAQNKNIEKALQAIPDKYKKGEYTSTIRNLFTQLLNSISCPPANNQGTTTLRRSQSQQLSPVSFQQLTSGIGTPQQLRRSSSAPVL